MKLYYSPGACSLATHIVLEWIGVPYQAVRVTREERKRPAFLSINSAGAVPVLELDGWALTQNAAILNFLADSFPDAHLGGDGTPKDRAETNRWLALVNSDMHPAFKPLFGATAYLGDDTAIALSKADARAKLRGMFERVDAQLAGRDWLIGSRTIADPYLYVLTRWAKGEHVDISGLHNLQRFVANIEADAGVQTALKDEGLT